MKNNGYQPDLRLNYIATLLAKISHKRLEYYVVSRIWHLLNDIEIEMVAQQYVQSVLDEKKSCHFLTDIYFPQIDIHIEVNEPFHYQYDEKINADTVRNQHIKNHSKNIFVVDCTKDIENIHQQIDDIVSKIKEMIDTQKRNGTFVAWQLDKFSQPSYWQEKQEISSTNKVWFRTVEEICELFDADFQKTKRGFLRKGSIHHPVNNDLVIWWPTDGGKKDAWQNRREKDIIIEYHSKDEKNKVHIDLFSQKIETRAVFYRERDILGFDFYRFMGVFRNSQKHEKINNAVVWQKISDTLNVVTGQYHLEKNNEL